MLLAGNIRKRHHCGYSHSKDLPLKGALHILILSLDIFTFSHHVDLGNSQNTGDLLVNNG